MAPAPSTETYAVGKQVDIWLPSQPVGSPPPVVLCFHGGGLMKGLGDRTQTQQPHRRWILDHVLDAGCAVLCPDYTLLQDGNAFEMIKDVQALFRWLDDDERFDGSRIGAMGSSAGCYISQLAATHAKPAPRVLGLNWGMGSAFFTDYWVKPMSSLPAFLGGHDTPLNEPMLTGTYLDILCGHPGLGGQLAAVPAKDRPSHLPSQLKPLFPELNLTSSFPPTALVHGTGDTIVLVGESLALAEALEGLGVEVQLELVEGGEHGLIQGLDSEEETQMKRVRVAEFVLRHLLD